MTDTKKQKATLPPEYFTRNVGVKNHKRTQYVGKSSKTSNDPTQNSTFARGAKSPLKRLRSYLDELNVGLGYAVLGPAKTQAERVIARFGGVNELFEAIKRANPNHFPSKSRIYKWCSPHNSDGTGGMIPNRCIPLVLKAARLEGIILTFEDLFPGVLGAVDEEFHAKTGFKDSIKKGYDEDETNELKKAIEFNKLTGETRVLHNKLPRDQFANVHLNHPSSKHVKTAEHQTLFELKLHEAKLKEAKQKQEHIKKVRREAALKRHGK